MIDERLLIIIVGGYALFIAVYMFLVCKCAAQADKRISELWEDEDQD
jgi:type IV secretory pathway VirB3-like protein